jgi:hypothetical protein
MGISTSVPVISETIKCLSIADPEYLRQDNYAVDFSGNRTWTIGHFQLLMALADISLTRE